MRFFNYSIRVIQLGLLLSSFSAASQTQLFESDDLLEITLSGNITELFKDRANDSPYHELSLSYKGSDNITVTIPIKVKTRGHFRKQKGVCKNPPLLLNFSEELSKNTLFDKQDKIKLVTPCQGEKFVVREYLAYKIYNLISPKSFKVRLVKIVFVDPTAMTPTESQFGFFIEEEEQMAKRNSSTSVEGKIVRPEQTDRNDFLTMAMFEYLIGNTDWSVQYLQNMKLISNELGTLPTPVPYDFDHAGIVGAPYAKPAGELLMSSIRERRYRGYCVQDMNQFTPVIEKFNEKKFEFYNLYKDNPLLDEGYIKSTIRFLDDFYKTINDPKRLKFEFQYPCDVNGTGNVVIKGLKKN
jgi:hypothetical protein